MTKHLRLADDPTEDRDDSMSNAALISHDIAVESFTDAFRRRVGMGPARFRFPILRTPSTPSRAR